MRFNPIRKFFPEYYVRMNIAKCKRENKAELKKAGKLSAQEKYDMESYQHHSMVEWYDWLATIEEAELVKRANKMGVYLDDIECPKYEKGDYRSIPNSHYYWGDFGDKLMHYDSFKALRKLVRQKEPIYRKERREEKEFWLKSFGVLIGVIGASTGFLAVYQKCGLGN
jgi:hypothetical protein